MRALKESAFCYKRISVISFVTLCDQPQLADFHHILTHQFVALCLFSETAVGERLGQNVLFESVRIPQDGVSGRTLSRACFTDQKESQFFTGRRACGVGETMVTFESF